MAGYWPISLLACLWTRNEQAWLINKGFIIHVWKKSTILFRDTVVNAKRARYRPLPARAANHSAFYSSSALMELSISHFVVDFCTAEDGEICQIVASCTQWMPAVAVGCILLKYHGASHYKWLSICRKKKNNIYRFRNTDICPGFFSSSFHRYQTDW